MTLIVLFLILLAFVVGIAVGIYLTGVYFSSELMCVGSKFTDGFKGD